MSTLICFQTTTELFCSVFKKICVDTDVFVSFSPVQTTTPYPFWKRCYTLSAHAHLNSTHAHFNISSRENWREISHMVASVRHFGYSRSSGLAPQVLAPSRVYLMTSPCFLRPHYKTAFSKSIVFKSLCSGERFRMAPFSVIVFGVVVWTTAVSGAKQLRFQMKSD